LGIDPGTLRVGWGALRLVQGRWQALGAGVLRPNPALDVPERLGEIRLALDALLAEFKPAIVVVEEAFAALNVQSALRIGEARGVALACAAACQAEVVQLPPAVAKKTLVGHGAAHKTQVAAMVARLLGLARPPEPLDATDALALALTVALRARSPLARTSQSTRRTPAPRMRKAR
jgi:crossover junction endodeoxyribonuclease RuvC